MIVHIDFETRSDVSLPAAGLHRYVQGDAFAVLCMGWAIDGGPDRLDGALQDEDLLA